MYCRHCGNKLPDDSRFCAYCGKSVAVEDAATAIDSGATVDEAAAAGDAVAAGDAAAADEQEQAGERARADDDMTTDDAVAAGDAVAADDTATAGDVVAEDLPADGDGGTASPGASDSAGSGSADAAGATVTMPAPSPAGPTPPTSPTPPPPVPPAPEKRTPSSKRWIPIVIAVVVVIAAIGIGLFVHQRIEADRIAQEERLERERELKERLERERLTTPHDVHIGIVSDGWDTDDGGIPMPMEIDGTTEKGDSFEEIQFVDSDGDGISLVPGTYEIAVAASPLAGYGRMYDYPTASFSVEIDDELDAGESVDLSDEIEIELTYPHSLTADGIELAREIALEAGYDGADELADKAYERYFDDEEDDQSDSSSSDLTGAFSLSNTYLDSVDLESWTYDGDFFEIDLPMAWEIDVATGGGDVLARHFVTLEGETILTIDVMHGNESVSGTISDAGGKEKLGVTSDGHAVIATRGNGTGTSDNMELIEQALQTIDID